MAGIIVGSVGVTIVPDATGFAPKTKTAVDSVMRDIARNITSDISSAIVQGFNDGSAKARASATQGGSSTGGAFADAFKARVEAALKDLPNPKVGVDATELDAELADIRERLAALGDVRVGVDLSAEAATAELDALKGRLDELGSRSPNIDVKVDAARASAELAVIQAEVDKLNGENADVDVNVDDHGSAAAAESGVSGLTAAVVGLGPALIPIGAAAAVGLGGIVTAAGAALGGLGVLALAFSGVSKALGLLGQEHTAAAAAATSAARTEGTSAAAVSSAQAQVKSAVEGLAQARANAANAAISSAEAVKNAEQSLSDAERTAATQQIAAAQAVTSAQEALNAAREQAARDLEAASDNQADAVLSQKQATIDLANAQATNTATQASSTATDLQKQQALLDVQKAQQSLVEANQQVTQTTQDNTKAQADGVSKAPAVVAATQALTNARRAQAQQEQQNAESVKKAEQGVTDALRAQSVQQRQSANSIVQAEQSVSSAMRAVQTASASAGSSGSTSLAKIHSQLALLSPATLAFAKYVQSTLEPAFRHLQGVAAGGLLPGVESAIKAVSPLIGPFTRFVGDLAATMGHLAAQAGKALTDPFWTKFFGFVAATAGPTLTTMTHILENLGKGFAGLLEAFYPVNKQLGDGLDGLSKRFANFGATAGQNSGFQSFLAYVKREGPIVVQTLGSVVGALGHIAVALAPIGDLVLKGIGKFADVIKAIPIGVLTALSAALIVFVSSLKIGALVSSAVEAIQGLALGFEALTGAELSADAAAAANPIGLIVLAIAALGIAIYELVKHWSTIWHDIKAIADSAWNHITGAFSDAWKWIKGFVGAHWPLIVGLLGGPVGLALAEIVKHWSGITGAFSDAWHWVSHTFSNLWSNVEGILTAPISGAKAAIHDIWGAIKSGARSFVSDLGSIWGGLEKLFDAPIKFVINTVLNKGLIGVWDWLVGKIPGAGDLKIPPFALPQGFAAGGVIPGYAPGRDSVMAMVSPGEAILRPEVTRALGADTIHGWNRAAGSGSMPHFSLGGIWGDVKGVASSIAGGAKNILDAITDPSKWLKNEIGKTLGSLTQFDSTDFGKVIAAVPEGIGKALLSGVKSLLGFGGGGSSAPIPSGQHLALIIAGLRDAGVAVNGPNEAAVNLIIDNESGWNARAINLTDSNAAAGDPSRGLMQTIMSTFEAHRDKKLPDDIYNPLANIVAGIGYAVGRYGSLLNVPGVVAVSHGQPYVGYDAGGTLDPGYQLTYNGTRQPEIVAPRQTFEEVMAGGYGGNEAMLDRLAQIEQHLAAAPALTGEAVAGGIAEPMREAAVARAREDRAQSHRTAR